MSDEASIERAEEIRELLEVDPIASIAANIFRKYGWEWGDKDSPVVPGQRQVEEMIIHLASGIGLHGESSCGRLLVRSTEQQTFEVSIVIGEIRNRDAERQAELW